LVNGWWIYCGKPHPASNNDITLLQDCYDELCALLDPKKDVIVCDKIFEHAISKIKQQEQNEYLCGWRKPKGRSLQSWQEQENKELSQQRGKYLLISF
jgi:hypothetical protein